MFKPREYQVEAIEHALKFFKRGWGNAIEILPTGSGKSVVIAVTYRDWETDRKSVV